LLRQARARAAEAQILEAAEHLLRAGSVRDLTLARVMARSKLSRPSFYVYFENRAELVLRLAERFSEEIGSNLRHWYETKGDPLATLRDALREVARLSARHGHLARALFEASSQDPKLDRIYRRLVGDSARMIARRIRRDIKAGLIRPGLNPEEVGLALTLMDERYIIERLKIEPHVRPELISNTLIAIWERTLYGSRQATSKQR